MFCVKSIRFGVLLLAFCLTVVTNVLAQNTGATPTNTPVADSSANPTPTTPASPASQPQPVQTQTVPVQTTTSQPVQTPETVTTSDGSTFQTPWFWVAVGLAVLIIYLKIRGKFSALSNASNKVVGIEEPEEDASSNVPWSEYLEMLGGDRFRSGTPLYERTTEKAQTQAQLFVDKLKEKMMESPDGLNTIPVREELQSLANRLHNDFVKSICNSESFWMKKVFQDGSAPANLYNLVCRLFRPIQAPVGGQIQLEVPAWVIAVLVVVGGIIGSWLTGFFTLTCNMKGPSDFITFIGSVAGGALFASGIFWVTANEKYRRWLEYTVFTAMGIDSALQLVKMFSFFNFFGGNNLLSGKSFAKRMCLYLASLLILMMTKRKNAFNYTDYLQKLEPLYFEQIQGIVFFVSSINQANISFEQKWKIAEEDWQKQEKKLLEDIAKLQKQLVENTQSNDYMEKMSRDVLELWDADIHALEPILHNIAVHFETCGFPVPTDQTMFFVKQLSQLESVTPQKTASNPVTPPIEKPARTLIWTADMENEYDVYGMPPEDGETVEVLERSVIRNGEVVSKGAVKRKM